MAKTLRGEQDKRKSFQEQSLVQTRTSPTVTQPKVDNLENLPKFKYRPLDRDFKEIRLIRLYPGRVNDEICLEIVHVPLVEPEPIPDKRGTFSAMQDALPPSWTVFKTMSGNYIYYDKDNDCTQSWHPVLEPEGVPGLLSTAPELYPEREIPYDGKPILVLLYRLNKSI